MTGRALIGLSAHLSANVLIAGSTLLTPALLAPVLGLHDYALVAFYLHLSILLLLFDLGLSGLLLRQLAEFVGHRRAGTISTPIGSLARSVEFLYWPIGIVLGVTLFLSAPLVARYWLNVAPSSADDVTKILRVMSLAFVFQWPGFLYQNALLGLGRQVHASVFSGSAAVARLLIGYIAVRSTPDLTNYFPRPNGL